MLCCACAQGLEQLLLRRAADCDPPQFMQCMVSLAELGRGPLAPSPDSQPAILPTTAPPSTSATPASAAPAALASPTATSARLHANLATQTAPYGASADDRSDSMARGLGPMGGSGGGGAEAQGLLLEADAQAHQRTSLLLRALLWRARQRRFLEEVSEASLLRLLGCMAKVGLGIAV